MTLALSRSCRRTMWICACLTSFVLADPARARASAERQPNGDVRIQGDGRRPALIFACDRQTGDLDALLTPAVVSDLRALGAGVALSTEDFTPARAKVVRRLLDAGIPMTAWIVLPKGEGYYVNVGNAAQTAARLAEFDAWTRDNDLRWQAVGLDIEPTLDGFAGGGTWRLLSTVVHRAFDGGRVRRARTEYQALVRWMHARGYRVQTHQLSFIADERSADSTILQRIVGILDVRGDEEVLMLYTSLSEPFGAALIWAYGPDAQIVAVGSTNLSGNAALDAKYPPLTWEKFSRDLRVARHFSKTIGIYSLEGCLRYGFMPRLLAMDWSEPVVIPAASVKQVTWFRMLVRVVLWMGSRILYFVAGFLVALGLVVTAAIRWWRRRRQKRARTHGFGHLPA